MSAERLSSTNCRNAMVIDGGKKRSVDNRYTCCLSSGQEALMVLGCCPVDRRLFVSVKKSCKASPGILCSEERFENRVELAGWSVLFEHGG